jgi:integrase
VTPRKIAVGKIRHILKNGRTCYEVDLGLVAGKKRRRYVGNIRAAREVLRSLENERLELGRQWKGLEPQSKWSVLEVLEEIKDSGLSVREVWDTYRSNYSERSDTLLEEAVEEFLASKSKIGLRPKYEAEIRRTLERFSGGIGSKPISSIRHLEIQQWLEGFQSLSTRKTMQARVSILFNWAKRQGYINQSPFERIEVVRLDQSDPQILTVAQCQDLIEASRQTDEDFLPYLALSLFEGIRPEECNRIAIEDIDLKRKQVTVSGRAAKTRNRRIVPMLLPAFTILSNTPESRWLGWRTNFRRRRDAIRRKAKIHDWPKDVLRHTAASHFYNLYGMDEATKALGHSSAIMLRHYRQIQSKEETQAWLRL